MAYTRKSKSYSSRRKTSRSRSTGYSSSKRRGSAPARRTARTGRGRSSGQTIRIVVEQMSAQNPLAQNPHLQTTTAIKRASF